MRSCVAPVSEDSAKQPCATKLSSELFPRKAHTTRVQKQIQNVGVQLVLKKYQNFVPEQRYLLRPPPFWKLIGKYHMSSRIYYRLSIYD